MYEMVRSIRFCGDRAHSRENPNPYKREAGASLNIAGRWPLDSSLEIRSVVARLLYLVWHHKHFIRESDSCPKSSDIVKTDT